MKETIIKVEGMVCGGCESRIKNALAEIKGVERIEANHKTGIVKVISQENVERKMIEDIINDIGFTIKEG